MNDPSNNLHKDETGGALHPIPDTRFSESWRDGRFTLVASRPFDAYAIIFGGIFLAGALTFLGDFLAHLPTKRFDLFLDGGIVLLLFLGAVMLIISARPSIVVVEIGTRYLRVVYKPAKPLERAFDLARGDIVRFDTHLGGSVLLLVVITAKRPEGIAALGMAGAIEPWRAINMPRGAPLSRVAHRLNQVLPLVQGDDREASPYRNSAS